MERSRRTFRKILAARSICHDSETCGQQNPLHKAYAHCRVVQRLLASVDESNASLTKSSPEHLRMLRKFTGIDLAKNPVNSQWSGSSELEKPNHLEVISDGPGRVSRDFNKANGVYWTVLKIDNLIHSLKRDSPDENSFSKKPSKVSVGQRRSGCQTNDKSGTCVCWIRRNEPAVETGQFLYYEQNRSVSRLFRDPRDVSKLLQSCLTNKHCDVLVSYQR